MPSHDLLVRVSHTSLCYADASQNMTTVQLYFQDDVSLVRSWYVNGRHYARTCEDWLARQDSNAAVGVRRLEADAASKGVGAEEGRKMFYRCVPRSL